MLITGVLQNGPAAQAGIRPGDVIVEVAGKQIANVSELLSSVAALKPGTPAKFACLRRDDAAGAERDAGPAAQAAEAAAAALSARPGARLAAAPSSGALVCLMNSCAAQMPTS